VYQLLRWGAVAFGLLAASCQWISSVEVYEADPLEIGCKLPLPVAGSNKGKVRMANLFASKTNIDLCVRPTGAASYGRPVLRTSGRDKNNICGGGLAYPQVTKPFAVPSGQLDFKIIEATKTCSSPSLAEANSIDVGTDVGLTLEYMGNSATAAQLVVMKETNPPTNVGQMNRRTRFVNSIPGTSLIFGVSDMRQELPAALGTPYTKTGIEYGHVAAPESATANFNMRIDGNGYLDFASIPVALVAAQAGTSKALLLVPQNGQGMWSLYAIGDPTASAFPVRGLLCNELDYNDDKQTTFCVESDIETFTIDSFNAGLYGAYAKVEDKRAKAVLEALAARGAGISDVLCISEINRHADLPLPPEQSNWTQDELVRLAKDVPNGYRHFVRGTTDQNTPFTNPVDQNGMVPSPPTYPPCTAAIVDDGTATTVAGAYKCLQDNCSSTGNDQGVTAGGTDCYSKVCAGALAGFFYGNHEQQVCFNCIVGNGLSYVTWAQNKQTCTTQIGQSFAFGGKPTSIMMSKFPILEQDQYVFPSAVFRRIALYARLEYGTNQDIDVYCVHAPPSLGSTLPYTGDYGGGFPSGTGAAWQENQTFAMRGFVEWVKKKSMGRPAIIAGDFSASAVVLDGNGMVVVGMDGLPVVGNVNPDVVAVVREAFTEAVPADYIPQCTRCRQDKNNLNLGLIDPQANLRVYLKDPWGGNPTTKTQLFMDDTNAIEINSPEYGPRSAYSDTFGYSVKIKRP
jgi:hypothetical protein